MKILALDYGDKRIGVAVCDELRMMAHGLETIHRKNNETDLARLSALIAELGIERIVVGYPLRLDGTEGRQCEKVNGFIGKLEARFSLPIVRWDETLSTKEAEEILRKNHPRKEKKGKGAVDRIAASLILQSYLDSQKCETADGDTANKM